MRLSRTLLALSAFLLPIEIFAESPSITGLTLGIPLAQAESKLVGYKVTTLQGGASFLVIAYAMKEHDGYLLEAVDGKLALIDHVIWLPLDKAVDQKTYADQVRSKYGKPSPLYFQYQSGDHTTIGAMGWTWDGSGHQINEGVCPTGFTDLQSGPQLPPLLDSSDRNAGAPRPKVVLQVPPADVAVCHQHLSVKTERMDSRIPQEAVNYFEVRLEDPSMLYPEVAKMIAAQRDKAKAAHQSLEQRPGPPL